MQRPIPSETPAQSFERIVLPSFQAYQDDPGSERLARAAAYDVAHLIEWVFSYYEHHDPQRLPGAKNKTAFREALFDQCQELRAIYDLSDANKHRILTVRPENRTIRSSTDAQIVVEDRIVLWDGRDFGQVLEQVVNFWRGFVGT